MRTHAICLFGWLYVDMIGLYIDSTMWQEVMYCFIRKQREEPSHTNFFGHEL